MDAAHVEGLRCFLTFDPVDILCFCSPDAHAHPFMFRSYVTGHKGSQDKLAWCYHDTDTI